VQKLVGLGDDPGRSAPGGNLDGALQFQDANFVRGLAVRRRLGGGWPGPKEEPAKNPRQEDLPPPRWRALARRGPTRRRREIIHRVSSRGCVADFVVDSRPGRRKASECHTALLPSFSAYLFSRLNHFQRFNVLNDEYGAPHDFFHPK